MGTDYISCQHEFVNSGSVFYNHTTFGHIIGIYGHANYIGSKACRVFITVDSRVHPYYE